MDSNKIRAIAFYLPQFHPTKENDEWWGKGFTEWTSVAKARPLFRGHEQPHIPADLGFYDLRMPEARKAQAELAKDAGIEGFCYWHYWFGNGRRLLDRPFKEVLESGKPDFPFCLAWANHSWKKKLWNSNGIGDEMLMEQNYPGDDDIVEHFYSVLPAFKDKRYICINGKPLFMIFDPLDYSDVSKFINIWRDLAAENGLKGICFVGQGQIEMRDRVLNLGFDYFNYVSVRQVIRRHSFQNLLVRLKSRIFQIPKVVEYKEAMKYWVCKEASKVDTMPMIIPNWDHTPRSGIKGLVLKGSTPKLFEKHVCQIMSLIVDKPKEERIVFVKSWNEWGEGNYLEPDLKYGTKYLEVLKKQIKEA